jgi:hypothetical protein
MKIEYEIGDKYSGFEWFEDGHISICFVSRISPYNGLLNTKQMNITYEQYEAWRDGMLIQKAFPNLTDDEREFILTGLLGDEFNKFVGENAIDMEDMII